MGLGAGRPLSALGEFELIEAGLSSIAKRTLEVMLFSSLQDRVASAYVWARSTGAGYHLTFIEQDFDADEHDLFEQDYMRTLFDYGVERGRAQAEQSVQQTDEAASALNAITEPVHQAADSSTHIASAAQEQSSTAHDIS